MLISIITPSFNQAAFLPRTLESVAQQTFGAREHLIFDPGSADGSTDLIRAYGENRAEVTISFEADRGQVHAINRGFSAAKGDVLTWLNSDDYYFDSEVLQVVAEFFELHPEIDVAYGRGMRVDAKGANIREAYVHPAGTDFLESLQHSLGILQPALFFRRRVWEKVGGLDESYPLQLDYEFWIRIAQAGFRFGYIDRLLAKATVHDEAKSTQQRQKQLNECLELVKDRFAYVPSDWIKRYAEFYVTQLDRKVERNIQVSSSQLLEIEIIETALNRRFNSSNSTQAKMSEGAFGGVGHRTLDMQRKLGLRPPLGKRYIVTSFDSQYFQQGLNLIASLHRTSFVGVDRIYVYPLALAPFERERLQAIEKVELIDYPSDLAGESFEEVLSPKARAYKAYAMRLPGANLSPGDLVLWMDAGLTATNDISEIFNLVADHDFFMADHDDSPSWPFFNISFTHPACRLLLKPSNTELLSPHLCSCIVGHRVGGRHQRVMDENWRLGKIRDAVLWPKNLPKEQRGILRLTLAEERIRADLEAGLLDPESLSQEKLTRLFPYYGHRTQSILSTLVKRFDAPSFSGTIYRQANKASSAASSRNWQASATETDRLASRKNLEGVTERTVVYHHRGIYHHLDGLQYKKNRLELFVLGNGPSLRGFDFLRLKPYDSLGMNAAYRYWDQVGFYPTYYACFDTVVQDSHHVEIRRLIRDRASNGIRLFFLRDAILEQYPELSDDPNVFLLENLQRDIEWFARDKVTTGSFSALVGLFLGYRKIFLLGVDLNYVEKLPEAQVDGRALEIVQDPVNNPNYFFDGYQVKGDRFNPPNRHPDMHVRSWRALRQTLENFPAEIVNLNPTSAVKDFPFDTFDKVDAVLSNRFRPVQDAVESSISAALEKDFWRNELKQTLNDSTPLIGPWGREAHQHVDESGRIALLANFTAAPGLMVDVGAHEGAALLPFARMGWGVMAFEPDDINRKRLNEVLLTERVDGRVTVDRRAVSDEISAGQAFYRSEQSTGISSLAPFHKSHSKQQSVDVTTLTDALGEKRGRVDFLKVDAEGYDLFVLEGFPWVSGSPAVVLCEFEDEKTRSLGYDFHKLAVFLSARGYSVLVSEWHPVLKYGLRHDWCRLVRYPCYLSDAKSWGNLIGFRSPVSEADIVRAFGGESVAATKVNERVGSVPIARRPRPQHAPPTSSLVLEPAPYLRQSAQHRWSLASAAPQTGPLLTARMLLRQPANSGAYSAGVMISASSRLQIKVSLARLGNGAYEGVVKKVTLVPGKSTWIQLSHQFAASHSGLRVQIGLMEEVGEPGATFAIEWLGVIEKRDSVLKRLKSPVVSFSAANSLFRAGDLSAALSMYLSLEEARPWTHYASNAWAAAMPFCTGATVSIEHLLALSAPVPSTKGEMRHA